MMFDVRMREVTLTTPVSDEAIASLELGDVVYLDGFLYTAREGVYRKVVDEGRGVPDSVRALTNVTFHCSPAARVRPDGTYAVDAVPATASFRFGQSLPRWFERAREFLDAERTRVVRSSELEAITGLTRHDLARQFRIALGTSPHRYLLMRRLDFARARLVNKEGRPAIKEGKRGTLPGCPSITDAPSISDVAAEAGFADQAHFTRAFRAAFGMTPGRYRALLRYTTSSVREVVSPKRPSANFGKPA